MLTKLQSTKINKFSLYNKISSSKEKWLNRRRLSYITGSGAYKIFGGDNIHCPIKKVTSGCTVLKKHRENLIDNMKNRKCMQKEKKVSEFTQSLFDMGNEGEKLLKENLFNGQEVLFTPKNCIFQWFPYNTYRVKSLDDTLDITITPDIIYKHSILDGFKEIPIELKTGARDTWEESPPPAYILQNALQAWCLKNKLMYGVIIRLLFKDIQTAYSFKDTEDGSFDIGTPYYIKAWFFEYDKDIIPKLAEEMKKIKADIYHQHDFDYWNTGFYKLLDKKTYRKDCEFSTENLMFSLEEDIHNVFYSSD